MIAILMATYNGENYIEEQLNSLLAQTVQDFIVYIQDDCSTDDTYSILKVYSRKYPNKFMVSRNELNTGGAKNNFMQMMVKHHNDYVMLCDQDDVWLPNKIELALEKMMSLEKKYGVSEPILVHTDLTVVDSSLNITAKSFNGLMQIDPSRYTLRYLLVQNIVTGCTTMYNQALCNFLYATPQFLIIHDWWLALIAGAFGKIGFINEQTILYRQHENNQIGAKNVKSIKYIICKILNSESIKYSLLETYLQAECFLSFYNEKLSVEIKRLIAQYSEIPKLNKANRLIRIFKIRTLKNGLSRKIGQIIYI
ncbi:MAG: glycosyltransferase family 2 protein [Hydrogenoanaerobacterium sp.]